MSATFPLWDTGFGVAVSYDKGTTKTAPNAEFAPPAGASSTLIRSAN